MSELREEAEALGIEVDGRWSDKRIQKEIDAVNNPAEDNEPMIMSDANTGEAVEVSLTLVRNTRANLLDLKCVEIAGNGEAELTADQMADKRVQRALETGVLMEA